MRYPTITLALTAIGCAHTSLSSEANHTWLMLDRAFTEWTEDEGAAIEAESDAEAAATRLHALDDAVTRWDNIKAQVVFLLAELERGKEVDAERLEVLFVKARALVHR